MTDIPRSLEETIGQARESTLLAIESGYRRLQVDLAIPEIALQGQRLAWSFSELFRDCGMGLKVLFADTGAAALARRDWGEVPFRVDDLGSRNFPIERKMATEDEIYLLPCPSAVEVQKVEELCNLAGDRPVILLAPQLEDVSIVGIGYAARQLRERFLSTLDTSYYLRPMEGAVVLRRFPAPWQVWRELEDDGYELLHEGGQKPMAEALDRILAGTDADEGEKATPVPTKKPGMLTNLQRFLRALSN
ncbi:DUF1995 family protein [Rubidibacter lacunae]|nr:DUF1995 family protein [Rubidibacter lacunae]